MPTLWRSGPYRFFVYAGDRNEPPHVHVERDNNKAKFRLNPVRLQNSVGVQQNRSQPDTEARGGEPRVFAEEAE